MVKDSEKLLISVFEGVKRVQFCRKKIIIKRSLKIGCSKNLGKLRGNQQSKRSFSAELHAKSGYLNDVDSQAANLLIKNSYLELFFKF